ncbi:MAG: 1-acyl-sn-glycerol-3-phosphate acyltransferase, partial [Bacillota bacterium]
MEKYYSSIKPFEKRKKRRPFFRMLKAIMKVFFPKDRFIWKGRKPKENEPFIFVCNHTKIYAPLTFLLNYDKPIRPWSNSYLLTYKECAHHMLYNVLENRKPKFLLYPLILLMLPFIVWFFRSMDVIPVYKQDRRIEITFEKAVKTIEEGVHQIVFPEKKENKVNDYIFELKRGFAYVAKQYYDKSGKIMNIKQLKNYKGET